MKSEVVTISVAKDFNAYPAGRTEEDGPYNGEKFRTDLLLPAYKKALSENLRLLVDFDGVQSFGSSFLEESFGGLVSKESVEKSDLRKRLQMLGGDPSNARYLRAIERYIKDAKS